MTKTSPKKKTKPKRVTKEDVPKRIDIQTTQISDVTGWESEGGYAPPVDDQNIVADEILSRKIQYQQMNKPYKRQVSEEEFLEKEDLTGFGPNSMFTPLEDR